MDADTVDLVRTMGETLLAFADRMSQQALDVPSVTEPVIESAALPTARGPRQQEIAELLVAAPDEGWKTSLIAQLVKMDQPNAYLALQALKGQGVVEQVHGADPQRWRLKSRYRQRQQIFAAARLVHPGEFTTYGDISVVVYGHARAGQAVGQVAAKSDDFPNPHRVLGKGGEIPPHWTDGAAGPEEAARRLREEGVEVLQDSERGYFAHPKHYIDSDALISRMNEEASA
jgi:alkylated DNA nucleotide flippase Atl1